MGDTIFDIEENEDLKAAGLEGKPGITLTQEQWDKMQSENAELKSQVATVSEKLESTNKLLKDSATPKPVLPPDPNNMSADDALALFAKDPTAYTTMVADGRISNAISEHLAPILQPIITTTHQGILQSERSSFDVKFGVGTFDEIILPTLQADLDQLTKANSNAMGDSNTVKALIDRISGTKRTELNEAETKAGTAREDAEAAVTARVVSALPPSMQPRPAGGLKELPDEASSFFDEIERATGERPDEDRFLAVHNADAGLDGYVKAITELEKETT